MSGQGLLFSLYQLHLLYNLPLCASKAGAHLMCTAALINKNYEQA